MTRSDKEVRQGFQASDPGGSTPVTSRHACDYKIRLEMHKEATTRAWLSGDEKRPTWLISSGLHGATTEPVELKLGGQEIPKGRRQRDSNRQKGQAHVWRALSIIFLLPSPPPSCHTALLLLAFPTQNHCVTACTRHTYTPPITHHVPAHCSRRGRVRR